MTHSRNSPIFAGDLVTRACFMQKFNLKSDLGPCPQSFSLRLQQQGYFFGKIYSRKTNHVWTHLWKLFWLHQGTVNIYSDAFNPHFPMPHLFSKSMERKPGTMSGVCPTSTLRRFPFTRWRSKSELKQNWRLHLKSFIFRFIPSSFWEK